HFHADHPVFSCSKIEQVQWNTWVSFQSAQWAKLGQFSVSGNTFVSDASGSPQGTPCQQGPRLQFLAGKRKPAASRARGVSHGDGLIVPLQA
ncbi:hypothetical protein FYM84_14865, partial [Pseudomonas sp. CAH-1]|nr:hypothetical protein [Pseudomonas sp. CAH-1]